MRTIKSVLNSKDNKIISVSSGESVYNAVKLMSENKISSLLVLEDEKLLGIITERDYT